jgi:predicted TIM-barrel enzyme
LISRLFKKIKDENNMEPKSKLDAAFGKLPIIGMIHLAGDDPAKQAIEEITLLENEGLNGVIVENYHGTAKDVEKTLEALAARENKIAIGVNILPNDYAAAFTLARVYKANFIQLDYVAGTYQQGARLNKNSYAYFREHFPDLIVLGGVWPKYYTPIPGSKLVYDLKTGMQRAEAIVVTGEGTGVETPLEKVREFRRLMGSYSLIIGAGLNPQNAYNQLMIADGAIVGSYFKEEGKTENALNSGRIKKLMRIVADVKAKRYS